MTLAKSTGGPPGQAQLPTQSPQRTSVRAVIGLRSIVAVMLAGAFVAPFVASGCAANTACIQWDSSRGACPSRSDALAFMQASCGPVTSVDGDAERIEDEQLCCYPVTQGSDNFLDIPCSGPFPDGEVGVGPSSVVAVGVSSGPMTSCGGVFGGSCDMCIQSECCDWMTSCMQTTGCVECIGDRSSCQKNVTGGLMADAVMECMWGKCTDECFQTERHQPDCDAAPPGGSDGSCFTIDLMESFCNPVTNKGCMQPDACGTAVDGTIQCLERPVTDNSGCSPCGATGWCNPGYSCLDGQCARICCDDTDCGSGHCDTSFLKNVSGPIGLCLPGSAATGSGAGGAGGAGAGGAGAGGAGGA